MSSSIRHSEKTEKNVIGFCRSVRSVLYGGIAGTSAVPIIQSLIYFKNIEQSAKMSYSHDPRVWYRGVGGFAFSYIPTTAIQTSAKEAFSKKVNPIFASASAGIVSSVVVCPFEGIMIQQQASGKSFLATVRHMYSHKGVMSFARGFLPTEVREGAFASAYLGAAPGIKKKMVEKEYTEFVSCTTSGIVAGTVAAVISQPFDTYKTKRQQSFKFDEPIFRTIFNRSSFKGLKWRIGMVSIASIVIPLVQEKIYKAIKQ